MASKISKSSEWFIDSAATSTMCNNKSFFVNLNQRIEECWVYVANGERLRVRGTGQISLPIQSDRGLVEIMLSDVLFVPDLDSNLISLNNLTRNNSAVLFNQRKCYLITKKQEFCIGTKLSNLYKVKLAEKCCSVGQKICECIHVWHKRFAHRNLRDVKLTLKKQQGIKYDKCNCADFCEACVEGKISEFPYPKVSKSKYETFDLFVSDVCEMPEISSSYAKSKYFLTVIDARSDFTFVYFLKYKSEVPDIMIHHLEMIENQFGIRPKTLRSDLGTEYLNNKLQSYLKKKGIRFQCTVGYAPAQNGMAERKNRTLVEAARAMLFDAGLPGHLWAEAVATANHMQNRTADSRFHEIPFETFFERPIEEEDYHVFGSRTYSMIPKIKRRKLDSKAAKTLFMGYDFMSKGYRVYDPIRKCVTVSRNVVFYDDKTTNYLPKTKAKQKIQEKTKSPRAPKYSYESSEDDEHVVDLSTIFRYSNMII